MKSSASLSPLYLLERFEVGVVQLDAQRHVLSMNDFARRVLPVDEKQPFEQMVLDFHPERSRPKVDFLLSQAGTCPVSNPPPMTMIINIPERVLLIKVTRMSDRAGATAGFILVFHDITEVVAAEAVEAAPPAARRRLAKIPTVAGQRILLVDAADILNLRSEGHYTQVVTRDGTRFCNLAISDLEDRLDSDAFMRVHRSHIVNLAEVTQVVREAGRVELEMAGGRERVPVSRSSASAMLARLGVKDLAGLPDRGS